MKYRSDFVTNSSSSSYICDITGHVESGWDIDLEECGMYTCDVGHVFMEEYLVADKEPVTYEEIKAALIERLARNIKDKEEYPTHDFLDRYIQDDEELIASLDIIKDKPERLREIACDQLGWDDRYGVAPKYCPLCQLKELGSSDLLSYVLKKNDITKESVLEEIKDEFESYNELKNYLVGS